MSQEAFDKVDKDIIDAKAAIDLLLAKRRSLMETLVKDLTPKKAFDMRLDQLLLENPKWTSKGRGGVGHIYDIYIEECEDENVVDWLKDPRYKLSCRDIGGEYESAFYKSVAAIELELEIE